MRKIKMQNQLKWLILLSLVIFLGEKLNILGQSFYKKTLDKEECEDLPRYCRYIENRRSYFILNRIFVKKDSLVCENGLDAKSLRQMKEFMSKCREKKPKIMSISMITNVALVY